MNNFNSPRLLIDSLNCKGFNFEDETEKDVRFPFVHKSRSEVQMVRLDVREAISVNEIGNE